MKSPITKAASQNENMRIRSGLIVYVQYVNVFRRGLF